MARGWESKSVEDQISNAADKAALPREAALTPQQLERSQRRRSLQLSLSYVDQQIAESRSARHLQQLQQARDALQQQLDALAD